MTNIFKSSTRIVLLMFALTICIGFILGRLTGEQFLGVAMVVFTAFYTLKGGAPSSATDQLGGK